MHRAAAACAKEAGLSDAPQPMISATQDCKGGGVKASQERSGSDRRPGDSRVDDVRDACCRWGGIRREENGRRNMSHGGQFLK